MDETVVEAALIHFHENNIFLFFQKPQLVFLEPQVLLNFINTIVAFSYKITKPDNKISPPYKRAKRQVGKRHIHRAASKAPRNCW